MQTNNTLTIPANTLTADEQILEVRCFGSIVSSNSTGTIDANTFGTNRSIASASGTVNDDEVRLFIRRTSSTTYDIAFGSNLATGGAMTFASGGSFDWTTAGSIVFTFASGDQATNIAHWAYAQKVA